MKTTPQTVAILALCAAVCLGQKNSPDRPISNGVDRVISGEGWTKVGDDIQQQHYRRLEGKEEIFTGILEALPQPQGASSLMRDHGYKLGDRLIAGRGMKALDAFVGKNVELRGKRLDMNLEGVELHEIMPASIRPLAEKP